MMQRPFITSFSVYQSIFTLSCTILALTWCRVLSVCGKQNFLLIILWHYKNLVNHVPFVTHMTFWNLKSMLKLVQMYSVLILQCRKNVLCLAPCCIIQWYLDLRFLILHFPWFYTCSYWFHHSFHRNVKFSLNVHLVFLPNSLNICSNWAQTGMLLSF